MILNKKAHQELLIYSQASKKEIKWKTICIKNDHPFYRSDGNQGVLFVKILVLKNIRLNYSASFKNIWLLSELLSKIWYHPVEMPHKNAF